VVELETDAQRAEPAPITITSRGFYPKWSPDSEWLVFLGDVDVIYAWSRAERTLVQLTEPGASADDYLISPDSRFVVLSDDPYDSFTADRRLVSLREGSSSQVVIEEDDDAPVEWLWPEPWLQATRPDGTVTIYDLSEGAPGTKLDLPAPIVLPSTASGEGLMVVDDATQWLRGLPAGAESIGSLPNASVGAFSPSGAHWAAIEAERGYRLHIANAASSGDNEPVADFGDRLPIEDGVRWLDDDTVAAVLVVPNAGANIVVAHRDDSGFRIEQELSVPGHGASARLVLIGTDPCDVPALKSSVGRGYGPPGCAAPYR
jgi:hypothetical protein